MRAKASTRSPKARWIFARNSPARANNVRASRRPSAKSTARTQERCRGILRWLHPKSIKHPTGQRRPPPAIPKRSCKAHDPARDTPPHAAKAHRAIMPLARSGAIGRAPQVPTYHNRRCPCVAGQRNRQPPALVAGCSQIARPAPDKAQHDRTRTASPRPCRQETPPLSKPTPIAKQRRPAPRYPGIINPSPRSFPKKDAHGQIPP